jgi:hypothetical protein
MGRGTIVPSGALPEPVRGPVNQALGRLGYRAVDEHWNAADSGTDPILSPPPAPAHRRAPDGGPGPGEVEAAAALITGLLRAQPSDKLREIAGCWPAVAGKTIGILVEDVGHGRAELQQAFPLALAHDPAARAADPGTGAAEGEAVAETIMASPATWQSLLAGHSNLVTELSAGRIRCVGSLDHGHADCIQGNHPTSALRAVAALLGLSKIPIAHAPAATAAPGP